jgi:superfamily II DNA/RNA helicase
MHLLPRPQAKTGTGKTAAFLIPTLDAQLRNAVPRQRGHVSCLIVSPTRELASQIAAEAKTLAPTGTRIVTCFGATNVKTDVRALSDGCDILVGTPGRLNDLIANCESLRGDEGVSCFLG